MPFQELGYFSLHVIFEFLQMLLLFVQQILMDYFSKHLVRFLAPDRYYLTLVVRHSLIKSDTIDSSNID